MVTRRESRLEERMESPLSELLGWRWRCLCCGLCGSAGQEGHMGVTSTQMVPEAMGWIGCGERAEGKV